MYVYVVQSAYAHVYEPFNKATVERLVDFGILECYDVSKPNKDVVIYYYRKAEG